MYLPCESSSGAEGPSGESVKKQKIKSILHIHNHEDPSVNNTVIKNSEC